MAEAIGPRPTEHKQFYLTIGQSQLKTIRPNQLSTIWKCQHITDTNKHVTAKYPSFTAKYQHVNAFCVTYSHRTEYLLNMAGEIIIQ